MKSRNSKTDAMTELVPLPVSILFLIAFLFPVGMVANMVRKYAPPPLTRVAFYGVLAFYGVYLSIVGIASMNGAFAEASLPPRIVILTTLPLLTFLVGVVFHTPFYKSINRSAPTDVLIQLHAFRFIGSFFLILLFLDLLPTPFALIAGIGDVATAASSFWIAHRIRTKKPGAHLLAMIWNSFGLADILVTSSMAIFFTKVSMDTGALGVDILATFPFCFIPAFAPPTIIFLHLSIYRKLLNKKFR